MRIIHLVTHLRLGAGRAIVDLAVEQARRGDDVGVVVSADAEGTWSSDPGLLGELNEAGVFTTCVGDMFRRDLCTLRPAVAAVASLIRSDQGPTVAHAHTAMTGAVAHWAGAPTTVVTCHGWNPARPAEFDVQDALAYSLADAVLSPSAAWAARVGMLPGMKDVTVVPYGFDVRRYPWPLAQPGVSTASKVVCVGELTRRKGQDLLLAAWRQVQRVAPHVELHFVGTGDMERQLRAAARTLGEGTAAVHFHGHVAAPYGLFRAGDVFCLPTRSDNQPVAIVEALLSGVPVVATSVGGIPEMLEGRTGCVVVGPEDVDALASALIDQLRSEPPADDAARRRAAAVDRHGVQACADATSAVYRRALEHTI